MAEREQLLAKYMALAKLAFDQMRGAEYAAYHRIVMALTTSDPMRHLLTSLSNAKYDVEQSTDPAWTAFYLRKVEIFQQAIDDLQS